MDHFEQQRALRKFLVQTYGSDDLALSTIDLINKFGDDHGLTLAQIAMFCEDIQKILSRQSSAQVLADDILKIADELESANTFELIDASQKLIEEIKAIFTPASPDGSGAETLKSIPDIAPPTQEIAPQVIVEVPKPENTEQRPSINLILPPGQPEEKPLVPSRVEESPVALAPAAPANMPVVQKPKPSSLIAEKLSEVTTVSTRNSSYPDGKDPYREAF